MKKETSLINPKFIITIALILGIGAVIGVLGYVMVIKPGEVAAPAEVGDEKNKLDELNAAEKMIKGYMEAAMTGDKNSLLPYVSSEAEKKIGEWPDDLGSFNLHLGKWEILSSQKINEEEFKFTIREYQEYNGIGAIGYSDNDYILKNFDGRYLVSAIEAGEYVVAIETENWKTFRNEEKGYEYRYPESFFLQEPEISIAKMASGSSLEGCYTRKFSGFDVKKVKIGEISYCLTESTEGAAGSIYVDSAYTNVEGDRIITMHFIVRYTNCGVFGETTDPRSINCERFNASGPKIIEEVVETFKITS